MKLNRFYLGLLILNILMFNVWFNIIIAYPQTQNIILAYSIIGLLSICIVLCCFVAFPKEEIKE